MKKKREFQKIKSAEGKIRLTQRGIGFVESAGGQEIEIPREALGTALPNDTVISRITGRTRRGHLGKVEKIIKRARTRFVGTIEKRGDKTLVIPDDRRISVPFVLRENLPPKTKVLVELLKFPEVRLLKVFGKSGKHETEIAAILYGSGFEYDFPAEAIREANEAARKFEETVKKEMALRRDFRNVPTFTIDPPDAKDFDDALSVREVMGGKWEVGVHIADVSFFARPGNALDRLAAERATSVYLVDRTIPMLPEALSAEICSLKPKEDRLVYSAIFELNQKGEIAKECFGRSIIRSQKRFTYEEAQKVLDTGVGALHRELKILNKLAKIFKKQRIDKGSILFDKEEVRVVLDEKNEPREIFVKPHYETQDLIEEWMLLANRRVAELVSRAVGQKQFPGFMFRVHDRPDREKIDALSIFLKGIGQPALQEKTLVRGADLNRLFRSIEGLEIEGLIKQAALRSMAKAIYTTKNIGHFGLAFPYYTHFTSPIRRYPDIVSHRLLDFFLKKKRLPAGEIQKYEQLAKHASLKEREAEGAERDSVKWMQAKYMARHIGKEFSGIITGVTDWGFYVEEEKTKTSGLVHVKTLPDDYYEFNERRYELSGKQTKKKFRLGDRVRIRVVSADPAQKQINYELIS